MAEAADTTAAAVWTTTLNTRAEIVNDLNQNPSPSQTQELEDRLAAVDNRLLQLDAPDVQGVTLKLELLWEASLDGEDNESRQKRSILADLRRLIAA